MPAKILNDMFLREGLMCPPNQHQIEFTDADRTGLYIEVRATSPGQGTYWLRYKDATGKTARVKIGRTGDISIKDAKAKVKKVRAEILLGADPQGDQRKARQVLTLQEYATEHFLPWIKVRKRSWRNDQSMLNRRILPVIGQYRLDKVTRHQLELLHNSVVEEGLSGAQADHLLKTVRFMYNRAIEHGFCKTNPAAGIKQFNHDNKIERYLDDAELARLLTALDKDRNQTVCNVIRMLLATGMRLGECLSSTWSCVDRKNRTLTIQASYSKSKKRRVIPLNDMAMDVLKRLGTEGKHTNLFVASRAGKPLKSITKVFKRILSDAQIEGFRIHDLRHCFCSYALQQGRSIAEVSQLAGHSSVQITMRYAHFAKGQLHDASNSAADHIASVMRSSAGDNNPTDVPRKAAVARLRAVRNSAA